MIVDHNGTIISYHSDRDIAEQVLTALLLSLPKLIAKLEYIEQITFEGKIES